MATIAEILAQQQSVIARAAEAPPPPPPDTTTDPAPVPFSETPAGIEAAAQRARDLLDIQRRSAEALARQQHRDALRRQRLEQQFQRQQLDLRLAEERRVRAEERERERKANIRQLRIERQNTFAQLMKEGDQARAVLFALGFGPENDVFNTRARQLGTTIKELKGAQRLRRTTTRALGQVLDRRVTIGRRGVRGLGTAISSARAFIQGGADIQTLLTSAFGVGSLKRGEQPGISQARLNELIQEVVPTGIF